MSFGNALRHCSERYQKKCFGNVPCSDLFTDPSLRKTLPKDMFCNVLRSGWFPAPSLREGSQTICFGNILRNYLCVQPRSGHLRLQQSFLHLWSSVWAFACATKILAFVVSAMVWAFVCAAFIWACACATKFLAFVVSAMVYAFVCAASVWASAFATSFWHLWFPLWCGHLCVKRYQKMCIGNLPRSDQLRIHFCSKCYQKTCCGSVLRSDWFPDPSLQKALPNRTSQTHRRLIDAAYVMDPPTYQSMLGCRLAFSGCLPDPSLRRTLSKAELW